MAFLDRDKVKIDLRLHRDFYTPGESVRGRLHLTVTKSVNLSAVRLHITGKEKAMRRSRTLETFTHFERVYTYFGEPADTGARRGPATGDRSAGRGHRLSAGEYDYPFQVELPPTLPPSLYCPVRKMKTHIYYHIEAHVVIPNGFDGRKRVYFTVFPAAPRSQWEDAHAGPVALTAGAATGATAQPPLYHPTAGAEIDPNDIAAQKAQLQRQMAEAQLRASGAAAAAAAAAAPTGLDGGQRALTLEDAAVLRAAGGGGGALELSVKVLPIVMALGTRSMFPVLTAANEQANTRTNRAANDVVSDDAGMDDGDGDGDSGDDDEASSNHRGGTSSSPPTNGIEAGTKEAAVDLRRPSAPADADHHSTSSRSSTSNCGGNCGGGDGDSGWGSSPYATGYGGWGELRGFGGAGKYGSAPSDGSAASSQPETICAPAPPAAMPVCGARDISAADLHTMPKETLPVAASTTAARGRREPTRCGQAPPLAAAAQPMQQHQSRAREGGDGRVPSVVRPAVALSVSDAAAAYGSGGGASGRPGGAGGSFTLTAYDDCKCLLRLTLHNGTRKKVRGIKVVLSQVLRFGAGRHHAQRSVKLCESRYRPPHGPLCPGQTITIDVQFELPEMLRLNADMHRRLPLPTLCTRTLEVRNALAVTFKGGPRLEYPFNCHDCVTFVSAIDERNVVPPAPGVYTHAHLFPETVVSGHVY